jgi:hypothetical protein
MPVHDFGIIDNIENLKRNIGYEPQKYKCISVDDEIINYLNEHLSIMRTYFHSLERPEFGLAYWGITIIPPDSLSMFYDVITSSTMYKKSAELNELASKIFQAKEENKYMIHFGIKAFLFFILSKLTGAYIKEGMTAANGFPFEVQTMQITSHFLSLISMQFSMEFSN